MAQVTAQPRGSTVEQSNERPSAVGEIRASELETIYLKDAEGNLVPFISALSFEEFEQAYRLYKKLNAPPQPPLSTLKSMAITGVVRNDRADLKITFDILVHRDGWVPTSLRLDGVYLRGAEYDSAGKHFTQYDQLAEGYTCWINGEKESKHQVTFYVVVPVDRQATQSRLSLNLPRAIFPQLNVIMPTAQLVTDEIQGAVFRAPRDLGNGTSEIEAVGLGGQFELIWRDVDRSPRSDSTVLSASGAIRVSFDGQHHISSDARLRVQSLTGPIDSFVVRLPRGMKNVPLDKPSGLRTYDVVVLTDAQIAERKYPRRIAGAELVEIRLAARTSDTVEVELRTRLAENDMGTAALLGSPLEAAGFEVVTAERRLQWGTIDVAVQGDWALRWENSPRVTRIGEVPDSQRLGGVVARFEYFQQPCSLKVRILPKATRVSIEPIYLVQIGAEQARLEATLKYKVSGTRGYQLAVDMVGWQLDAVVPESVLPLDSPNLDAQGPLTLSLSSTAASSAGESELRILAHRAIDESAQQWSFALPRPQATTVTPATLVVLPEDNIDLIPLRDEMTGLAMETSPPQLNLPIRQQSPLFYRDQSDAGMTSFVGRHRVRSQSISVATDGRLRLDEDTVEIEQRMAYRIDYEASPIILLDVPDIALQSNSLSVALEDKILPFFLVDGERPEQESSNLDGSESPVSQEALPRSTVRIDLPADHQIGGVDLLVRYSLQLPILKDGEDVTLIVPLVVPHDDDSTSSTSNELTVAYSDRVELQIDTSQWELRGDSLAAGAIRREFELTTRGDAGQVPLVVSLASSAATPKTTVVHKSWLQTWLTPTERRDRFALELSTVESKLRISLPRGARSEGIEVAVDGHRVVDLAIDSDGTISVDIPSNPSRRQRVLEVWYSFDGQRPGQGRIVLSAPRVVGASQSNRWYWQLVLPHGEHMLGSPNDLIPELTWRWREFYRARRATLNQGHLELRVGYWVRRATLNQRDLESWVGATHQAPLPEATNQYLFSTFGATEPARFITASRRSILLVASLIALTTGMLLIYVPALRHPGALLAVGVGLLAVTLYDPVHAMLAAQAAGIGLVLVVATRLMDWMIAWRTTDRNVVRGTSITHLDLAPSDSQFPRPEGVSQISTATAPPVIAGTAPPDSNA